MINIETITWLIIGLQYAAVTVLAPEQINNEQNDCMQQKKKDKATSRTMRNKCDNILIVLTHVQQFRQIYQRTGT